MIVLSVFQSMSGIATLRGRLAYSAQAITMRRLSGNRAHRRSPGGRGPARQFLDRRLRQATIPRSVPASPPDDPALIAKKGWN
ncbi:hypothetical protein [Hydrocarboniphaga effusa]|uniref:hypothetical protein n=1 Tax=Hydrocarboniphaga effusa TaxID=243629 RepID=UPI00398BC6BC